MEVREQESQALREHPLFADCMQELERGSKSLHLFSQNDGRQKWVIKNRRERLLEDSARLLRQVRSEQVMPQVQDQDVSTELREATMRHQMDTRLRSLFSDSQSPLQSSSGDSVSHEKRIERIIHNLCCAQSGLDPSQLAALTQEPLTKCLFGKWDNEYQSDRNFTTIFDKLSRGQAVEGFLLFQGKLRHYGKIVVPFSLTDNVLTAMHQYVPPGRDKLIELVRRKFSFTFRPSVLKKKVTELVKRCPVCQTCKTGPARFD